MAKRKRAKSSVGVKQAPLGFEFKSGQPITPAVWDHIVESRVIDETKIFSMNRESKTQRAAFASNTVQGASSIVEQARALKDDPQLIYQFVHDNIEWEPGWGVQKGALGCLLDGMGNSFDQCMLVVELLREAGFTASYVKGTIKLTEAEFNDWFGTSSIWAAYNYCGNENIPAQSPVWNGSGWDMIISHMWLTCEISSTTYVFDPSRKSYTRTAPVSNLGTILGYNATTFMSNAESGATIDVNGEHVQNMNKSNISDDLEDMADSLVTWIENNDPDATVGDIIGGQKIQRATIPLLQTSLPYQAPGDTPTIWATDIPLNHKTTLRVRYPGSTPGTYSIDETFTSDQLAASRLTLFFNGSLEPELRLDGVLIATGNAQGSGTWNSVLLTVKHNAYAVTWYDQEWWQSFIYAGRYYLIGNSWGNLGRGQMNYHVSQLAANAAAGGAATSEPILGEQLAVTWESWAAQNSRVCDLVNRITNCHTMYNHQVGIISFDTGDLLGTDIGGVSGSSTNLDNDVTQTPINDTVLAMHGVALEAAVLMQMTGSGVGASTTTVIDKANSDGDKIYKGTSSNWNSGTDISSILNGNGYIQSDLDNIYNWYVQWGNTVLISEDPVQTLDDWQGWGYWVYPTAGAIGIINGGLKGGKKKGKPEKKQDKDQDKDREKGDPIDIFTGAFVYRHEDLAVGTHHFPYRLAFKRSYSSGNRYFTGALGAGWTHNFHGEAVVGSNGFLAMGQESAIQGAASIAELFVCVDLISDTSRPLSKLVTMTLADRWWIDQLCYNIVSVSMGEETNTFVKLSDGTYSSSHSFPGVLTETAGEFKVTTPEGVEYNFNTDGQIVSQVFPYGVTVSYSYTLGVLTSVSNGFDRTLSFTYTGDKITEVSDGTGRSVSFAFDVDDNLETFTDADSKDTNYSYDVPGRMTEIYFPKDPLNAFVENEYDTLGRVKKQTNARGKITKYYFAGSRAEEEDPIGNSQVWYMNRVGQVVREIDQLDKETVYEYDGINRIEKVTFPEGNAKSYTYDKNNNILTVTEIPKSGSGLSSVIVEANTYDSNWDKIKTQKDALGNITTYTYDSMTGALTKIERPVINSVTPTVTFTYNTKGQILSKIDESGVETEYVWDSTDDTLISVTVDPGSSPHKNLVASFEYDSVGNTTSITDPRSNETSMNWDDLQRVLDVTDPSPLSYISKQQFDANGNKLNVKKETGIVATPWQITSFTYSETDKVRTKTDPANNVSEWIYDDKDRIVKYKDAELQEFEYVFDAADNLIEFIDPTTNTSEIRTYTDNGKLDSVEDARGKVTKFTYDGLDRLDRIYFGYVNSTTYESYEQFTYDDNYRITEFRTRSGDKVEYTYDVLNRIATKKATGKPTITFAYDLVGRLLSTSTPVVSGDPSSGTHEKVYDSAGRFYKEIYPDGKTVEHELDGNENRTKTTWPDGYYVNREFDELNRLTAIKLNGSTTAAVQVSYDKLSRRTLYTFANGTTSEFSTELNDDLTEVQHDFTGGSSVSFLYEFDKIHRIKEQEITDSNFMWHPPSAGTVSYGTADDVNLYPSVEGTSYSYDDNSNLESDGTWTYSYDPENQLLSASKTGTSVSMLYDPHHRQVQKQVGIAKTRYIYSDWQRIADYDGVSGNLENRYVYGIGLDEPLIQVSNGGTLTFLHQDRLGTVVAISNNSGGLAHTNKFGPFGEVGAMSGTTFGFTGQRHDSELNLHYYKHRYYSPEIGRFIQPDRLGIEDGPNLVTYAHNDPLNNSDPYGDLAGSPSNPPLPPIPDPCGLGPTKIPGSINVCVTRSHNNCPTPPPKPPKPKPEPKT